MFQAGIWKYEVLSLTANQEITARVTSKIANLTVGPISVIAALNTTTAGTGQPIAIYAQVSAISYIV